MQHTQNLHFPEMDKPWRTSFCLILNPQGCKTIIFLHQHNYLIYDLLEVFKLKILDIYILEDLNADFFNIINYILKSKHNSKNYKIRYHNNEYVKQDIINNDNKYLFL